MTSSKMSFSGKECLSEKDKSHRHHLNENTLELLEEGLFDL